MDAQYISETFKHPTLISTPWFMAGVLIIYLGIVLYWGPQYMKHRRPYELKTLIIVHNIIQVLSCVYVIYEIMQITQYEIFGFWKCTISVENYENIARHLKLAYFVFWLKISELAETVIFVLRKKQNQVSKLHVFHHLVTITLIYMLIHYNENGFLALFPVTLNSMVHIIMYSYYLIAAVADKKIVRSLLPLKKSITVLQMVQFVFILLQVFITSVKCGVPLITFLYYCLVISIMFYGFYDFYKSSYKKSQRRKSVSK